MKTITHTVNEKSQRSLLNIDYLCDISARKHADTVVEKLSYIAYKAAKLQKKIEPK